MTVRAGHFFQMQIETFPDPNCLHVSVKPSGIQNKRRPLRFVVAQMRTREIAMKVAGFPTLQPQEVKKHGSPDTTPTEPTTTP